MNSRSARLCLPLGLDGALARSLRGYLSLKRRARASRDLGLRWRTCCSELRLECDAERWKLLSPVLKQRQHEDFSTVELPFGLRSEAQA